MTNKLDLSFMNNHLQKRQFTEEELIQYRPYYDSIKCLRTQKNLSAYFCFRYLYDTQEDDSADDWTCYTDVVLYLNKNGITDVNYIEQEYQRAMEDRNNNNF
jgi:hypothetical protein